MTNVPEPEQYRIKLGDLDYSDSWFRRRASAAWSTYLLIAAEVHPPVISSLLSNHALDIFARYKEGRASGVDNQAEAELERFIAEWCGQWGFREHYARLPAHNTLGQAFRDRQMGGPEPLTFVCDVHGRRYEGTNLLDNARVIVKNGHTGEVTELGLGAKLPMDLPDFHWEPTTETLPDALKRITDAIKPLVRAELQTIRDSYLANGYEQVVAKRDKSKDFEMVDPEKYRNWGFEWVARQQLRGETPQSIADILSESLTKAPDERTIQRRIQQTKNELLLSDDSKP